LALTVGAGPAVAATTHASKAPPPPTAWITELKSFQEGHLFKPPCRHFAGTTTVDGVSWRILAARYVPTPATGKANAYVLPPRPWDPLFVPADQRWALAGGASGVGPDAPCTESIAESVIGVNDMIASGGGVILNRPGLYVVYRSAWHEVWEQIPTGTPRPEPTICKQDRQDKHDLRDAGDYLDAEHPAKKDSYWALVSRCDFVALGERFVVVSKPRKCTRSDDSGPGSDRLLYVNQYDAASRDHLPIPGNDKRPGGNACGPSAFLMALDRISRETVSKLDLTVDKVYLGTQKVATLKDGLANSFVPANAIQYLISLGGDPTYLAKTVGKGTAMKKVYAPIPAPKSLDPAHPYDLPVTQELTRMLGEGPVVVGTMYGMAPWGSFGGGHVILVVSRTDAGFVVEDPAGNYTLSPGGHYGKGKCGHLAIYPVDMMEAYVSSFQDRWLLPLHRDLKLAATVVSVEGTAGTWWIADAKGHRSSISGGGTAVPGTAVFSGPVMPSDTAADFDGNADLEPGCDLARRGPQHPRPGELRPCGTDAAARKADPGAPERRRQRRRDLQDPTDGRPEAASRGRPAPARRAGGGEAAGTPGDSRKGTGWRNRRRSRTDCRRGRRRGRHPLCRRRLHARHRAAPARRRHRRVRRGHGHLHRRGTARPRDTLGVDHNLTPDTDRRRSAEP
jgi:hypothetical protein